MKTDLVFPEGNEQELIEMALALGYEQLVFVYDALEKVKILPAGKIKLLYGVLVNEPTGNKLTRKIDQIKGKKFLALVQAGEEKFNRFVVEKTAADMLFNLEYVHKKDHLHYRKSGLDEIICRIAARNRKIIAFSFSSLLETDKKGLVMGRMMQNIRFCRKFKVKTFLGSFTADKEAMRSPFDLQKLAKALDADEGTAKEIVLL